MSIDRAGESENSDPAYCADLVRRTDFERYAATLFLPPSQRRAVLALHAFDIEIGQVRGHVSQALAGEIRLQWWSDVLAAAARGDVERSPVAAELLRVTSAFPDLTGQLGKAVEARWFDLYDDPMPDLPALEHYLLHVFSAPYLLDESAPIELVRAAALATGLIATIERLPQHASRQQLYLPLDLIERHGVKREDLFAGRSSPELSAVVQDIALRADTHLQTAKDLIGSLPPESRQVYLGLGLLPKKLRLIALPSFQPLVRSAPPSHLATLWTLWRASRTRPFAG